MSINVIKDSEWVKNSFMIPTYAMNEEEARRRLLGEVNLKFTDTSLGGNMVMNPSPQFTRFADIKVVGRYAAHKSGQADGSSGMGRYYSEAIDDNKEVIHMRFGVPAFNSLTKFFTGFFDPAAGYLANTGRTTSFFFTLGKAAGYVVGLPLLPLNLIGSAVNKLWNFFAETPNSKYYYLKPTMPLYWNAVNAICNGLAVNMGIVPRVRIPGMNNGGDSNFQYTDTNRYDPQDNQDASTAQSFYKSNPNIYNEGGGIDIYRVANRAQRLADIQRSNIALALENNNQPWYDIGDNPSATLRGNLLKVMEAAIADRGNETVNVYIVNGNPDKKILNAENLSDDDLDKMLGTSNGDGRKSLAPTSQIVSGIDAYLELYLNSDFGQIRASNDGTTDYELADTWDIKKAGFDDLFTADRRGGSDFVSFKVDHTGTISESFSNNTKESDLQEKINSMGSSARSMRFNIADGNLGDGPIGSAVKSIYDMASGFAEGLAQSVGLGGLMALTGRGFVDIPKMWESSSVSMPSMNYTIELRSPYGNKMSLFQNIYVPLAMLLAGTMPISTGKQSWTSPFLVEVHSKGRVSCRLGLVTSLSISRGEGNMGWTDDDRALGINVSFTVEDLSSMMHMPINPGNATPGMIAQGAAVALGSLVGIGDATEKLTSIMHSSNFDEDNNYNDYLSVLSSLGLEDMIYSTNKLRLSATRRMTNFRSWWSMGHFSQFVSGTVPGRVLMAMSDQMSRGNQ